jgi:hypothetical protein
MNKQRVHGEIGDQCQMLLLLWAKNTATNEHLHDNYAAHDHVHKYNVCEHAVNKCNAANVDYYENYDDDDNKADDSADDYNCDVAVWSRLYDGRILLFITSQYAAW